MNIIENNRKCACGCKTDISGTHGLRKYADNQHKDRVNNSKKKKERVEFDQYKIDKAAYVQSISILEKLLENKNEIKVQKSHLDFMNVIYDVKNQFVISLNKDRRDHVKIDNYILKIDDDVVTIYKTKNLSFVNIS